MLFYKGQFNSLSAFLKTQTEQYNTLLQLLYGINLKKQS